MQFRAILTIFDVTETIMPNATEVINKCMMLLNNDCCCSSLSYSLNNASKR